jgi:hypothetical protein
MHATHELTSADLAFPPQVPFSWTRRWARAHRADQRDATRRSYRIAGCATNDADLAAAVAFCREHAATLELD